MHQLKPRTLTNDENELTQTACLIALTFLERKSSDDAKECAAKIKKLFYSL